MLPSLEIENDAVARIKRRPYRYGSQAEYRKKKFKIARDQDRYEKQFSHIQEESEADNLRSLSDFMSFASELTGINCRADANLTILLKRVFFEANRDRTYRPESRTYQLLRYLPEFFPGKFCSRVVFDFHYTLAKIFGWKFFQHWRETLIESRGSFYWLDEKENALSFLEETQRESVFYTFAFLYFCYKNLASKSWTVSCYFEDERIFKYLLYMRKLYPPLPFDDDFAGYRNDYFFTLEKAFTRKKIPWKTAIQDYQELAIRGKLGTREYGIPSIMGWCTVKLCHLFFLGHWRSLTIDTVAKCLHMTRAYHPLRDTFFNFPRRFSRKGIHDYGVFLNRILPRLKEIAVVAGLCLLEGIPNYIRQAAVIIYTDSCIALEGTSFL